MGRDVEVLHVTPVTKALPESIVSTDVTLRSNGYDGKTVHLELREDRATCSGQGSHSSSVIRSSSQSTFNLP